MMALTGCCLVLFVTFHVLMNAVAIFWPTAYNAICGFLGANWYALIASAGLAALFIVHIIYAIWLTLQNRRARGNDRYAVTAIPPHVEWSSQNMLVLGIVIVAFLGVHMIQFWAKMQLVEALHTPMADFPQVNGVVAAPEFGTLFLQAAFQEVWTPIVYIIGFVALWFHLNHGFWSMLHTIGWDNNLWLNRLKSIACWWTSIVVALFIAQAIVFTVRSHSNYYSTNLELQEQYGEFWKAKGEAIIEEFQAEVAVALNNVDLNDAFAAQTAQKKFLEENGQRFVDQAAAVINGAEKQCPEIKTQVIGQLGQFKAFLEQNIQKTEQQAK